jgi:hypothetical protein
MAEEEWCGECEKDFTADCPPSDICMECEMALRKERDGLRRECVEVEQRLGTALNYPAEGSEVGGDHSTVCVSPHTPGTIAAEAAKRIQELERSIRQAKKHWMAYEASAILEAVLKESE